MRLDASDIHVIPRGSDGGARPVAVIRFRVAGVLCHPIELDGRLLPALIAKWKALAACDVNETRRPQDGRIMVNIGGEHLDLRVCFIPAVGGESVTLRLLRPHALAFDLAGIPYSENDMQRILDSIALPSGMVLFVGPTGTGKTTTMYSALRHLTRPELKILTFEDPVEFTFPGVVQIQKDDEGGMGYHAALRSILRSDPDIVMVGEIRDLTTLQILAQTALTGHLVLSQMHTDDAPSTPFRMIDVGLNSFLVADTVKLVVSQRLVRKLCPHCSREATLVSEELAQAMSLARVGGVPWDSLPHNFRQPVGCEQCGHTGYRGRTVMAETMVVTPELGAILRRGGSVHEVRSLAIGQGMTTMHADGIRRAAEGQTTIAEVFRTLPPNR
jgi:type II secretory ATPase GspE/PulE/Tfp pilus assembly ATPase PilB-like protein